MSGLANTSDYIGLSLNITVFNNAEFCITLFVISDSLIEGREGFLLAIATADTAVHISENSTSARINIDDSTTSTLLFDRLSYPILEGSSDSICISFEENIELARSLFVFYSIRAQDLLQVPCKLKVLNAKEVNCIIHSKRY